MADKKNKTTKNDPAQNELMPELDAKVEFVGTDKPLRAIAHVVLGALSQAYETIVLAMHDVELALRYTTRVIGVQDGRIVLDEPSQTLSASDLAPLYQS